MRHKGRALVFGLMAGLLVAGARAEQVEVRSGGDHVGLFRSIVVHADDGADDVACMFCSIRIEGPVRGDVALLFGSLDVEPGQQIHGDVASLFSGVRLGPGVRVDGDFATLLGRVETAPGVVIHGDQAAFGSTLSVAVLAGMLLLGVGLVWLVVWGARRVVLGR